MSTISPQTRERSVRSPRDYGDAAVQNSHSRGHAPDPAGGQSGARGGPPQQEHHALHRPRPVHGAAARVPRHCCYKILNYSHVVYLCSLLLNCSVCNLLYGIVWLK